MENKANGNYGERFGNDMAISLWRISKNVENYKNMEIMILRLGNDMSPWRISEYAKNNPINRPPQLHTHTNAHV